MTWKVTQRHVWKDSANLQIKQLNIYTKVATPCLDDHQFEEEEMGSVFRQCWYVGKQHNNADLDSFKILI